MAVLKQLFLPSFVSASVMIRKDRGEKCIRIPIPKSHSKKFLKYCPMMCSEIDV